MRAVIQRGEAGQGNHLIVTCIIPESGFIFYFSLSIYTLQRL